MHNMTTGSPLKRIINFSIPLLIGNIFQLVYNMVDTFIVGRTMGRDALAGISASSSVMFLILGFAQGLTAGLTIPLAQAFGARDFHKVRRSVTIAWTIALCVSMALTFLSTFFLRQILEVMMTPPEIIQYTYDYLIVIFSACTVTMLYNLLSNMMRALGDSRTPLYFLIIAALTNIVVDYVFIVNVGMGVAGAGFATVLSQAVSVVLCLWAIHRRWPLLQVSWQKAMLVAEEIRYHLNMGFPMAFQSSIIALGSISVTVALNQLGPLAIASYGAASKIEQIVILVLMSFGIAMATYVGQNFGAAQFDRIRQGVRQMTFLSVGVALVSGVILALTGAQVVTLFAEGNQGLEMAHYGQVFFYCSAPAYWLLALLFIYRYTLQGLGDSLIPTIAGIMELTMRMSAALILSQYLGFVGPAIASPLAWLGACVPLFLAYHHHKHHLQERFNQKLAQN